MEGYCRGCLVNNEEPTELFQYTEKNRRLYIYSTGLQVKRNDIFPFQLCKDCYSYMKQSCKFKKQCRTSDKRLKNYLAMRDSGDVQDFSTFLRNNDYLPLRFPTINGCSTPAQRTREDDNESTCTSIRNFISDLVPADELPDADARIVRELIQEEADVLDDSLDSRWLEDDADMSIGSDYRLDLSVSPFQTPRSTGERYFPQSLRLESLNTSQDQLKIHNIAKEIMNEYDPKHDTGINDIVSNEAKRNVTNEINNKVGLSGGLPDLDIDSNTEIIALDDFTGQPKKDEENLDHFSHDINEDASLNSKLNRYNKEINQGKKISFGIGKGIKKGKTFNQFAKGKGKNLKMMKMYAESEENYSNDSLEDDLENEDLEEKSSEIEGRENEQFIDEENHREISVEKDSNKMDSYVEIEKTENIENECVIDTNLEEALRNGEDNEYFLDDLINTPRYATPSPAPNIASAISTPTINNILFGKTLDIDYGNQSPKSDKQYLEKCKDSASDVDVFEDFFYKETDDANIGTKENTDTDSSFKAPLPPKYNLSDFSCNICNKKFGSEKGIKIHFRKLHKEKIILPKKPTVRSKRLCNHCGKDFYDRATLARHIQNEHSDENKDGNFVCKVCSLVFSSGFTLSMHMEKIHNITKRPKETKTKFCRYVCPICVYETHCSSNYRVHMARHDKRFTKHCLECGKGFFRNSDLEVHERTHMGMKLFSCPQCDKKFARREWLNFHIKKHNDDCPFKCEVCGVKFVAERFLKNHKTTDKCSDNHVKVALKWHQESEGKGKHTCYYVTEEIKNPALSTNTFKKHISIDLKKLQEDLKNKDAVKVIDRKEIAEQEDCVESTQRDGPGVTKMKREDIDKPNIERDEQTNMEKDPKSDLDYEYQIKIEDIAEDFEKVNRNGHESNENETIDEQIDKIFEVPDLDFNTDMFIGNSSENCSINTMEVDSKVVQDFNNESEVDIEALLKI